MRVLRLLGGLPLLLWLCGCASTPQTDALLAHSESTSSGLRSPVMLDAVPFFPQEAFQCGPAALATVLQDSGVIVLPDALVNEVYVPARKGSLQIEMLASARRHGRIAYVLEPALASVLQEVQSGNPVLVMQNLGLSWYPQWHYAVVVGFDLAQATLVLRSGLIKEYQVPLSVFERTWQRADRWAVVLLTPGELPADNREEAYFLSLNDFARSADSRALANAYEVGLSRWPHSIALAMARANLYYSQGELDSARAAYEALLLHSPDYAVAHNNLAQTLVDLGRADLARVHAEQAVRIGGDFSASFRETLDAVKAAQQPDTLPTRH